MARTIEVIKAQIVASKDAETNLSSLNSTSQTAIWNLWAYIVAVSIYYIEVLVDLLKSTIDKTVADGVPGTAQWMKNKTLSFQYDLTTPQLLSVGTDFTIKYDPIDTTKQIITRCAVVQGGNKEVNIKVAKSATPEVLTALEKSALQGFWSVQGFAGVTINIINEVSDKLYLKGNIYYDGQYSEVIEANVITAIKAYLASLPFDGVIKLSAIEDTIQGVTGVKDVTLLDVALRSDSTAFASTTYMKQGGLFLVKSITPYSGYAIEENTSTYTFADKLDFIIE
jgi:hypothetical protein